jgi:transcriptional activator SPT8
MVSFDDEDPNAGSNDEDEDEDEDEEMQDANQQDQDNDEDEEDGDEGDDDNDDNDNDNDDEDDEDEDQQNDQDGSPSQRASQHESNRRSASRDRHANPAVVLTSPSRANTRSPGGSNSKVSSFYPPVRPEALTAQAYDIVPTMAAPQSTSINAIAATPDMRWVFSGGSDGYVRMYNWVETANGKVPLTVAQKHPFVDSVMKAGSLLTYWENEEPTPRTPPSHGDEGKWISPVYSLAVQHQAVWLLSGLESGAINLQTCRHQAGTRISTLRGHTSAVSVLSLAQDETSVLSGSWDKTILDWDLQTGQEKRSFKSAGSQIGAIEVRPLSSIPVPEISEEKAESLNGTFASNNADKPIRGGSAVPLSRRTSRIEGEDDAMGSPEGSLFGEGDHGSLFGDDTGGGGGGNAFGDDDDDLTKALESEMQGDETTVVGEVPPNDADAEMGGMGDGGPVQASSPVVEDSVTIQGDKDQTSPQPAAEAAEEGTSPKTTNTSPKPDADTTNSPKPASNPSTDEPLTAPPTNDATNSTTSSTLPPKSESTFLDAAYDGTLRIWDRRMPAPIATIAPHANTPPWCTGACWSPDGNSFYVGRRNCTVDEYSVFDMGRGGEPRRTFKFQQGSGPVSAVRGMPNGRHLVW